MADMPYDKTKPNQSSKFYWALQLKIKAIYRTKKPAKSHYCMMMMMMMIIIIILSDNCS